MIYFDLQNQSYFSVSLSSGKMLNITEPIATDFGWDNNQVAQPRTPVGIAGWMEDDAAILIYDNYDIWKVDPENRVPAVNITNSFGKKNDLKLRLLNDDPSRVYATYSSLIFSAFNTSNKHNGFCRKVLGQSGNPEMLTLEPCHLYRVQTQADGYTRFKPIKALEVNKWLVMRESYNDAPNFFVTSNFKQYQRLTDIQPQRSYNWLSAQLVTYKQTDGIISQGILYKPENFDSTRKYPVIFSYYMKKSQELFSFHHSKFCSDEINIPYYVSNGYLVFTPDIYYTAGRPGESALNSVVAAAQYLSKMPWIDSSKMGLWGHSFGAFETNYIVTRTSIFAAAVSNAGLSNLTNFYNGMGPTSGLGYPGGQVFSEIGQIGMGVNFWERPDLYIDNSPIFKVNKVVTPLLMVANKNDAAVPWDQGFQFFIGLRRLQKKVWLLQYEER